MKSTLLAAAGCLTLLACKIGKLNRLPAGQLVFLPLLPAPFEYPSFACSASSRARPRSRFDSHSARARAKRVSARRDQSASCASRSLNARSSGAIALPGSPSACRDAWQDILVHQLDNRFRPCNFVELMPRLQEHQTG